jgi:periplasmic protein TonB
MKLRRRTLGLGSALALAFASHAAAATVLYATGDALFGRATPPADDPIAVDVAEAEAAPAPGAAAAPSPPPAAAARAPRVSRRPARAARPVPHTHDIADFTNDGLVQTPAPAATTGLATSSPGAVSVGAGGSATGTSGSRARRVGLLARDWRCPWPREAAASDSRLETVVLQITVEATGRARTATVTHDPGSGFGPAAVACAVTTPFLPALDSSGTPIPAQSTIRVRFTR